MKNRKLKILDYHAREGSRFSDADAKRIGPELTRLVTKGINTTQGVLTSAKDKRSPLHCDFDWDDKVAGPKWRTEQARHMLAAIEVQVVTQSGQEVRVRAFHAVQVTVATPASMNAARDWHTVASVAESPIVAEKVIADAKRELNIWRERYVKYRALFGDFEEQLGPIFGAIDRMEFEGESVHVT